MSYATVADLVERYGEAEIAQRTDRVAGMTVDAAIASRALADASAEIDGYLATRYRLPLPTVPAVLSRIGCAIARYRLWEDLASDRVRQDYEDARRFLEAIASGRVTLGLPADLPEAQQPQASLSAARSGAEPLFDRHGMGGF